MIRYRVETAKTPQSSFCASASEIVDEKDAHKTAEALAPDVEEVRVMKIETIETELRRFSITKDDA